MSVNTYDALNDTLIPVAGGIDENIVVKRNELKDTVGWTGKNLCPYATWFDRTHGVTFLMDNDGVITANGTAEGQNVMAKAFFTPPFDGQLILNGCNSGNSKVHIYPYDQTNSARPYKDSSKTERWDVNDNVYNGNEISFFVEAGVEYSINCRVVKNYTADNVKFYPMLRKAEISDSTFEPYHKDVVDTLRDAEVIEPKNLFHGRDAAYSGMGIELVKRSDGSYLLTGTVTGEGGKLIPVGTGIDTVHFVCKAGVSYVLSGCPAGGGNTSGYWLAAYPMDSTSTTYATDKGEGGQFKQVFEQDTEVRVCIRVAGGYTCPDNFVWKPMICTLEEWNRSRSFEPYFVPLKDSVPQTLRDAEVIKGKNIIPVPYFSEFDGNNAGTIEPTVNSDGSITFSAGTSSSTGAKYYYLISRFDSNFEVPAGRYWCSGIPSDAPEGITMVFGCTRNGEGYTYNTLSAGDAKVGNVKTGDLLGITIKIDVSTTISAPITFYPMLCTEAEWNKSHTYEPYYIPVKDAMLSREEQRVLGAKNLYDTNATSKTDAYGGVWTVNSDKTITVSGTPTDYEPFSTRSNYILPIGKYIISWNEEKLTNVALDAFRLCKGNTEVRVVATNKTSALSFTITNSDDYDNIRIAFKRATNNVAMSGTIKPMIRLASDTDSTYVPYAMTNKELTDKTQNILTSSVLLGESSEAGVVSLSEDYTNFVFIYIKIKASANAYYSSAIIPSDIIPSMADSANQTILGIDNTSGTPAISSCRYWRGENARQLNVRNGCYVYGIIRK